MTESKRYHKAKLYKLGLDELHLDPRQPRKYFDEQALAELTVSIKKHGVLEPILARRGSDGTLQVVSGERRYQAALRGGLATVPVLITDGDPVEIAIVENLLRESLTAIEEAEAIDRLRSEHNYTLTDLPEILGKAESTLSEILALNKLPETVKNDCRNDPKAARRILTEIAKCGSPRRMTSLYEKYKAKGLTRGELRSKAKGPQEKPATAKLCLVRNFLKRLEALETAGLEESQLHQLAKELEQLRLVAQAKLEALRPQAQG